MGYGRTENVSPLEMHFLQQGCIPKENHRLETKCPNTRPYGEHLSLEQSQVYSGQIVWQKEERKIGSALTVSGAGCSSVQEGQTEY